MKIDATQSVTELLIQVKGGDEQAAFALWERYFRRLVRFAETRIPAGYGRVVDAEDVACTAMDALLRGAREGRFRKLEDRDDLWQLLIVITIRRAKNVVRGAIRGPKGESQVIGDDSSDLKRGLVGLINEEPSIESVTNLQETYQQVLSRLDPQMQKIVRFRLAGHTHAEIAEQLGVVTRTIERKMSLIRKIWLSVFEADR